jgi:hypothetical protein
MECRDIQISGIAAKSLAEPPEACRPQEGLKTEASKHLEVLGRAIRRVPHREAFITDVKSWGGLSSWRRRRWSRRKVQRPDEGDDRAGGRSSDLTRATTEPEGGLATERPEANDDRAKGRSSDLTMMTTEPEEGLVT